MSVLRASNIRNINVLVDGNVLDSELDTSLDAAFQTHKTYSLNKIYVKGAFHPKIVMLVGITEGLLIIGSGNITNAGLNTNDEIWGAFHLDSLDGRNAPLFASVWKYLEGFLEQLSGFNALKIGWLRDHSPWITKLNPPSQITFVNISSGVGAAFLANWKTSSIYEQMLSVVGRRRIDSLTIISPFYDIKGQVLEQFLRDFNVKRLICITDVEFGKLPSKLEEGILKKVEFYDWKDCVKKFDTRFHRLHAKAIHFDLGSLGEYFMLGSPNATVSALGAVGMRAANSEAAIILQRKSQNTFLQDLGIVVSSKSMLKPVEISEPRKSSVSAAPHLGYEYRIQNAELSSQRLTIYLRAASDEEFEVVLLGRRNKELQGLVRRAENGVIQLAIREPMEICAVYLRLAKKRVSNLQLVHDVGRLSRTNPSSAFSELSELIESIANDPENNQYIELLRHVDYSWVDTELEQAGSLIRGNSVLGPKPDRAEKQLSSKEFYNLSSRQQAEASLLSNPSLQIAEVLGQLSRGLLTKRRHFDESSEEKLSQQFENESSIPEESSEQFYSVQIRGEEESRALEKHWNRVGNFYEDQLEALMLRKSLANAPSRPITLKDLSNISISLELMFIFCGRKYSFNRSQFAIQFETKYSKKIEELEVRFQLERIDRADSDFRGRVYYEVDPTLFGKCREAFSEIGNHVWVEQPSYLQITHWRDYLIEGVDNEEYSYGLKAYLVEMLSAFLICCNAKAGQVNYEYDLLNEKVEFLRRSIFQRGTFLCLNATWYESELYRRDLILLDLLHFIYPGEFTKNEMRVLRDEMDQSFKDAHHRSNSFRDNCMHYFEYLLPTYVGWRKDFDGDRQRLNGALGTLNRNSIGFSSRIGFFVIRSSGKGYLVIEKPCFQRDEDLEGNFLRLDYPQGNVILFGLGEKRGGKVH